jgi:predicted PurR-regulated permease PerM
MSSRPVQVRTIITVIGLVLAAYLGFQLVIVTRHVLMWMVVALFFAVALSPLVDVVERRLPRCRRTLATLLVFLAAVLAISGLVALFVIPLVQEASRLAGQLPKIIDDVRAGRGPVADLLRRTHTLDYLRQHREGIQSFAAGLGTPALSFIRSAATTVVGVVTIFVLAYLMVLQGPKIIEGSLGLVEEAQAARLRRVGSACARTVTGYLTGNLLISVICGVLTYLVLLIAGVPFAELIALFVAVADLIPLVGATLGAVAAGIAAFLHSLPTGIVVVVFFILYQQVENHLLQPVIMGRTVKLSPLTVVLAILFAVQLAGILGALLAIPVAGMLKVVLLDVWAHRRGRRLELPMADEPPPGTASNSAPPGPKTPSNDRAPDR